MGFERDWPEILLNAVSRGEVKARFLAFGEYEALALSAETSGCVYLPGRRGAEDPRLEEIGVIDRVPLIQTDVTPGEINTASDH